MNDTTSATSSRDIPQTKRFKNLNGDSQFEQDEHQNDDTLSNDDEYYYYTQQEDLWEMESPIDDFDDDIGSIDNYETAHNSHIEDTPNDSIIDTFPEFGSFPRFDDHPSFDTSNNGSTNHLTTISSISTSIDLTAAAARRSPNEENEAQQEEVEYEQKKNDKDNRETSIGARR